MKKSDLVDYLWHGVSSIRALRTPSIKYCIDNSLFPNLFTKSDCAALRKQLFLPPSEHTSQLNQDIFALLVTQFKKEGYFLEIGANDGFTLSNTAYLETAFKWSGILVEANPRYSASLAKRTSSIVINKAIADQSGIVEFVDGGLYGGIQSAIERSYDAAMAEKIVVECMTLQEILDGSDSPTTIDFVSIDVEGFEVPIVEQLVKCNRRFTCGCIEHNFRTDDYTKIAGALRRAEYEIVWEHQTAHDMFFIERH